MEIKKYSIIACVSMVLLTIQARNRHDGVSVRDKLTVVLVQPEVDSKDRDAKKNAGERERDFKHLKDKDWYSKIGIRFKVLSTDSDDVPSNVNAPVILFFERGNCLDQHTIQITEDVSVSKAVKEALRAEDGKLRRIIDELEEDFQAVEEAERERAALSIVYPGMGTWWNGYYSPYSAYGYWGCDYPGWSYGFRFGRGCR